MEKHPFAKSVSLASYIQNDDVLSHTAKEQPVVSNHYLVPLSKLHLYQSALTVPAARWHRFMNTNGFNEKVCRKFGRKVLIHLPSFFEWLEEGNQSTPSGR